MQARNNIQAIRQSNRNMLWDYSKSCNRSDSPLLMYLLFTLSMALMPVVAFAQHKLSITPKVGVNIPTVRGLKSETYDLTGTYRSIDNRIGFQVGADVGYRLGKMVSVSSGLNYILNRTKFHEEDGQYGFSSSEGYLQVPAMLNFHPVKGLSVKAGIATSMLLHGSWDFPWPVEKPYPGLEEKAIISDKKKTLSTRWLFTLPVGLSYEYKHFVVEALYHIGLNKIIHKFERNRTISYFDTPQVVGEPFNSFEHLERGPLRYGYVSVTLGYQFGI